MRSLEKSEIPARLLEIPDPPKKLYLEGNLPPADSICLAVVGSRDYTEYGKKTCEKLIAGLKGKNVSIVSGLAIGIDAIAHNLSNPNLAFVKGTWDGRWYAFPRDKGRVIFDGEQIPTDSTKAA